MKLIITISLFITTLTAFANTEPTVKVAPTKHIYAPHGFDSNDELEVVVEGYLPDLCHQSPTTEVRVIGRSILIEASSLHYENTACPQVVLPFLKTVKVGVLPAGDYNVFVNKGTRFEKQATIAVEPETKTVVNDYIYANVFQVTEARQGVVKIIGAHPADCFELQSIDWIDNGVDTYSVLPKLNKTQEICQREMIPFEYEFKLPTNIDRDKILIHVRDMIGGAVNYLYEVAP